MDRTKKPTISAAKRKCFFDLLGKGHTVTFSAVQAKISHTWVYELKKRDEAFAADWEAAEEAGIQALEEEARRRATSDPHHSDTLLIFLLKSKRPAVYRDNFRHEISGPDGGPVQVEHELGDANASAILRGLVDVGLVRPGPATTADSEADEVRSP